MAITLPFNLTAKTLARASEVMANFNALVAAVEGVGGASASADVYQGGVLTSTDWNVVTSAMGFASGTGIFGGGSIGGAAWLPGPSGALVRTFTTPAAAPSLKPPVLPGPSGWVCVGFELTASGGGAVLSVVSGAEQASEALALANPPAVSSGKVRIADVPIKNSAGVYGSGTARDRRPWARGAYGRALVTAITQPVGNNAISGLTQRVECSGAPVEGYFNYFQLSGTDSLLGTVKLWVDGVELTSIYQQGGYSLVAVGAGSHLFEVRVEEVEASFGAKTRAVIYADLLIRERVGAAANNGTA